MTINVGIIRESFALAKPIANQIVDRFYQNLFGDFPESEALFREVDMKKQKAALIGALVTAVDNLDQPETLTKYLLAMGARHVKYGVEDAQYDWVGESLLKTFGQFFGSAWTPELQEQWAEVYGVIAETMKKGARSVVAAKVTSISKDRVVAVQSKSGPFGFDRQPLSVELKDAIRVAVNAAVMSQIKDEIQRCYDEEMHSAAHAGADVLVRKVP